MKMCWSQITIVQHQFLVRKKKCLRTRKCKCNKFLTFELILNLHLSIPLVIRVHDKFCRCE